MSIVSDYVFIYISSLALGFTWTKYYIKDNIVCLSVAAILSVIAGFVYGRTLKKRSARTALSQKQLKKLDSLKFRLLSDKNAVKLIADLFIKDDYTVTFLHDSLIAQRNDSTVIATVCFSSHPLSPDELFQAIDLSVCYKAQKVLAFCCKASPESLAMTHSSGLTVEIYDLPRIKTLLDNAGIQIAEAPVEPKKRSVYPYLAKALSRNRSGFYFATGIMLLLSGFIAFSRFYYFTAATLSFALAAYSRFNSKFNESSFSRLS